MKLRWLAVVVWLGAACFTTYFASSFISSEVRLAIEDRSSLTVKATLLSEPVKVQNQLGNSPQFRTEIKVLEPIGFAGTTGSLNGDEKLEGLHEGDIFVGSIAFKPAFGFATDFSSSLRYVKSIQHGAPDFIHQMRASFLANLSGVTPDSAALVAGLAIGDDSKLSQETKDNFKVVSLTHLSAVSGANCAIVLAGAALLLNFLPLARGIKISLSFGVIGMYLALVGQQASVLRASVMVGVVLLGFLIGRRVSPIDAISLSVVLLLLYEPALAMNYGFALSVLATLGLLVLAPRFVEVFAKKIPSWLAIVTSVSLAAQIACLPVLLLLQPKIPVYSILANVLAEPLVAPITVLGLLACLVAPVIPMVSICLSMLASFPAAFIVWLGNLLANAPMASLNWFPGLLGLVLGVLLALAVWLVFVAKPNWIRASSALVIAGIVLSFGTQSSLAVLLDRNFYSGDYTLINCDVGQGDALVIRSKGKVAVVDVGREDPAIDACLTSLGISQIDLLVLTHFDMDHIGGVVGAVSGRVVAQALITSFVDSRPGADFANAYLAGLQIPIVKAEAGMTGKLGEFSWQVLSPHKGAAEAQDSNDGSVTMLWQDSVMALFTMADLGERGQLRIGSENGPLLTSEFEGRVVVVKVAHHGSADQASEFYEAIHPALALVSVGQNNSYGHPTRRLLQILDSVGAEIVRTDQSGAIGVSEGDAGLSVSVSGRS